MEKADGQVIQYRDDLVRCFVDTEFYEDGNTIDLISIGAVRSDGAEFYAVSTEAKLDRVSPWVREHVLTQLPPYSDPAWMIVHAARTARTRLAPEPSRRRPGVLRALRRRRARAEHPQRAAARALPVR